MADPFKHTRDARRAFSLISIVPARVEWLPERGAQVVGWLPLVGLFLGAVAWLPLAALSLWPQVFATLPAGVLAALVLVIWAVLTRLLHWDGLADVADAIWGSSDRERRLEIMKDSHVGAFGGAAIALFALLEWSAVAALVASASIAPLLWAPAVGRMAATFAAWLGTPARPDGLGAAVSGKPKLPSMLAAALSLALAATPMIVTFPMPGAVIAGLGFVLALVVPHLISEAFGGVTGDVMGASVLVTETLTLVLAALTLAVWHA